MKATPAGENVVLLLASLAVWPKFLFHWTGVGWTIMCYATLASLLVIFIRRLLRFRTLLEERRKR